MTNTTTRKQLFTAVAMLLVAAVALGTATYAWFVNNTAVGVEQMEFQASASSSMEISLPDNKIAWNGTVSGISTGAIDWTGIITTAEVAKYHGITDITKTSFGAVMPASSVDATNFFAVKNDGWNLGTLEATTFAAISDFKDSKEGVMMIPMYMRSSQAMDVYLSTKAAIAVDSGGGQLTKALRIAIVNPTTQAIFEPNEQEITMIGRGNTTAKVTKEGQAVTDADGTVGDQTTVKGAAAIAGYQVGDVNGSGIAESDEILDKTALFKLPANTPTLVKVYIWLEGCDYDCVSAIASGKYGINLNFIGAPTIK